MSLAVACAPVEGMTVITLFPATQALRQGPGWSLSDWVAGADPCTPTPWTAVTCQGGTVSSVDLSYQSIEVGVVRIWVCLLFSAGFRRFELLRVEMQLWGTTTAGDCQWLATRGAERTALHRVVRDHAEAPGQSAYALLCVFQLTLAVLPTQMKDSQQHTSVAKTTASGSERIDRTSPGRISNLVQDRKTIPLRRPTHFSIRISKKAAVYRGPVE